MDNQSPPIIWSELFPFWESQKYPEISQIAEIAS